MVCCECNKPGHKKRDCTIWKRKYGLNNQKAKTKESFVAMINDQINIVQSDNDWWVDSGASKHICKDRSLFKNLVPVEEGKVLYMGNSSTVAVKGIGQVELVFTSGKTLTLNDVFYVPEVRKNFVSGFLLNKFGFKQVYEADKFILSKGSVFVGKGYAAGDMFKLNVIISSSGNDMNVSSYMLVYSISSLWHNRLGHVNYKRLKEMSRLELIPDFDGNIEKCKTCMLTKITRSSFPNVQRITKLLELIHSDLGDFHSTPSLEGKKYYVTFIDDFTRYCQVYLLNVKNEALDKFRIFKNESELHYETLIKKLRSDIFMF